MKYIKSLLSVCLMLSLINLNAQRISEQFKTHWFDGYAEISSYSLDQSRYGEVREGNAVLIYVTEDFLKKGASKSQSKVQDYSSCSEIESD
ncbi:hypothetical protein OAB54_07920 [Flavobacteriaceae bacterium]|nr:hypothetical protein [Flavobacteriaceae bacterium]